MHVFNKILNFEILNSRFYCFPLVVVVVLKIAAASAESS